MIHTWHDFDVIRRMHGHHFCVDPHTVIVKWIERPRNLNERKHRLTVRVKVVLKSIWA